MSEEEAGKKKLFKNRGEWSEFYVVVKSLFDGESKPARGVPLKVHRIVNEGATYIPDPSLRRVRIFQNGQQVKDCDTTGWKQNLDSAWKIIRAEHKSIPLAERRFDADGKIIKEDEDKSSFPCQPLQDMANELGIERLKSPSNKKDDTLMQLGDDLEPKGYSIKSEAGAASSALNASFRTHCIYKVKSTAPEMEVLNRIAEDDDAPKGSPMKNMMKAIGFDGLEFECIRDKDWQEELVRDRLEAFAEVVKSYFTMSGTSLKDFVDALLLKRKSLKPRFRGMERDRWIAQMKALLYASEYGEEDTATGGSLTVKSDGSIVCSHGRFVAERKKELFEMAMVDTADRKKHDFGYVYCEGQFPPSTFSRRLKRGYIYERDWVKGWRVARKEKGDGRFQISADALRERSGLDLKGLADDEIVTIVKKPFCPKWKILWEWDKPLNRSIRYINIAMAIRNKNEKRKGKVNA
jgi:hypothetical protein